VSFREERPRDGFVGLQRLRCREVLPLSRRH
jgi:hypothetical protein